MYYALASGQRQENHGYDLESVKKDAEALAAVYILNLFGLKQLHNQFLKSQKACKGKINEKVFIKILTTISFPQLYATLAIFSEIAKEDIESIVRKHTSGNLLRTCLTKNNIGNYKIYKIYNNKIGVYSSSSSSSARKVSLI